LLVQIWAKISKTNYKDMQYHQVRIHLEALWTR